MFRAFARVHRGPIGRCVRREPTCPPSPRAALIGLVAALLGPCPAAKQVGSDLNGLEIRDQLLNVRPCGAGDEYAARQTIDEAGTAGSWEIRRGLCRVRCKASAGFNSAVDGTRYVIEDTLSCFNSDFMINGRQIKAAQVRLTMSQQQLAVASQVAKGTIARFELGLSVPHDRILRDLRNALDDRGIEFPFAGKFGVSLQAKAKLLVRRE